MRHPRLVFLLPAAFLLTLAILPGLPVPAGAQAAAPPMTREAVEQIIRQYLLDHPEVITDSLRSLEERQRSEERRRAGAAIAGRQEELLRDPATPVGGSAEGDVTVVEFFDYQCGYCKRVAPVLKQLLVEDPKVRVLYKELPILGPESVLAAQAALAAHRQGKYERFHDLMMESPTRPSLDRILEVAQAVGLDLGRLREDMESPAVKAALDKNHALAQAIGLRGTPAFVVGSELIPGAADLETLHALVTKARGR